MSNGDKDSNIRNSSTENEASSENVSKGKNKKGVKGNLIVRVTGNLNSTLNSGNNDGKHTKYEKKSIIDEMKAKYDRCLYGESDRGVFFVEKDGLYGVINKEGEELVPCKYPEYSDARQDWADMGFTTKKTRVITPEQKAIEERKLILDTIRKELINEGHINRLELYNGRAVLGAVSVKLPNGGIGVAVSVVGQHVEVFDENGDHFLNIGEPEGGNMVLCSDGKNLYVGAYGTKNSYIAAYEMETFERKWKIPMQGSQIQSITVNDSEVAIFDMEGGIIKYFDKENGVHINGKDINTKKNNCTSHINLASMRIATIPDLEAGVDKGMNDFCNKLQIFNNKLAKRLAGASLSSIISSENPIAVDEKKGRVYIAIENMIGIFDTTGCIGIIPETTRSIMELNFDSQTNCLLVSMLEGKGKVEAFDAEAINEFIKKSNWTNKQLSK